MVLKVLGFTLLILGFFIVYTAKYIVTKFGLAKYFKADESLDLTKEEIEKLRFENAVIFFKICGFVMATPGIVIILTQFY